MASEGICPMVTGDINFICLRLLEKQLTTVLTQMCILLMKIGSHLIATCQGTGLIDMIQVDRNWQKPHAFCEMSGLTPPLRGSMLIHC